MEIAIAAVLILIALWCYVFWWRTWYTPLQAVLYFINILFTDFLWRVRVKGRLAIRPGEPAVVVSNHISGIDPLLIQRATNCCVHWMVAREYIEHWSMGWAFRILRAIPVGRAGTDTAATKQAIRWLEKGESVGMFPEGRINRDRQDTLLLPGRPGAALVALRARVPVIPCYVADSPYNGTALGSFLMTAKARVVVGEPIDISAYYDRANEREVQELLTRQFLREIARLAGVEDFEPQLAGRRWRTEDSTA